MQSLVKRPRALVYAGLIAGSLDEHYIFFLPLKESSHNWLFIIPTCSSYMSRKYSAQFRKFTLFKVTP
ncbi:hypothetical protein AO278_01110 [Pseudomonas syringae pv. syringae]|nr:hypothetical protein AO278_01110 [Pseudomonas syringae pv. syringae]